MRTERSRLAEKVQPFTSLFDRAMDLRYSLRLCSPLPILRRPDLQHARALRTRKDAESLKRYVYSYLTSDRLFDCSQQRTNDLLIHVAKELERQMDRGRLRPGDAYVTLHLRFNSMLQLLLDRGKLGPQLLRQFDGKKRPDHFDALSSSQRRRRSNAACDDRCLMIFRSP